MPCVCVVGFSFGDGDTKNEYSDRVATLANQLEGLPSLNHGNTTSGGVRVPGHRAARETLHRYVGSLFVGGVERL